MLEPKDKSANSFIMEFIVCREDKGESIEEAIQKAMNQIESLR